MRVPQIGETVRFYPQGDVTPNPMFAMVVNAPSTGDLTLCLVQPHGREVMTITGSRHVSRMTDAPEHTKVRCGGWDYTERDIALDAAIEALSALVGNQSAAEPVKDKPKASTWTPERREMARQNLAKAREARANKVTAN